MEIKCYYNKNLKMSDGKMASQIGHLCKKIGWFQEATLLGGEDDKIIVLGLRQNKFKDKFRETGDAIDSSLFFFQVDSGFTEVEKDTLTCFGYVDKI